MNINLPSRVRFAIYIFNGLGSIVVVYLAAKGIIGDAETVAFGAFNVFTSGLAALNVEKTS